MNSLPLDQNLRPSLKPSLLSIAVRNSIVLLGMAHASVNAAEITVTSNLDDNGNGCTLREAINSANSSVDLSNGCAVGSDSGIDQINFDSTAFANANTITLSNGQLLLADKALEINAQSIGGVTVSANRQSRVMQITGGDITLNSITISDGEENEGAGIFIRNAAKVTLMESEISHNVLPSLIFGNVEGGGVNIQGSTLILHNSLITRNTCENSRSFGCAMWASNNNVLSFFGSEISYNTITGVSSSSDSDGIRVDGFNNTVTITNSLISNNDGTGIDISGYGSSVLDLVDSVIENNVSSGGVSGGMDVDDLTSLNIIRSRISGNAASAAAAGISVDNVGSTQIVDSVISDNTSNVQVEAAGLSLRDTDFVIQNTTISNNTLTIGLDFFALGAGVTVLNIDYGLFSHVTMSGNNIEIYDRSYGSSLAAIDNATLVMQNSIIANSEGAPTDCFVSNSQLTIDSASIIEDGSCGATQSGDPGLLALADNGGPTPTHALSPNSIAINTGDTTTCLETDQRGAQRDALCDVGAFEFGASVPNEIDDNAAELFVIPLPNGKTVIFSL